MYIIESYNIAVLFCFITMLCWGSWANTQKISGTRWRFEYFYWDYVIGIVLISLVSAFTLGSIGESGRSFITDLKQAHTSNLLGAFIGGVIFNAANILLVAAISIAGMAVAFPIGIGLALILGVLVNYQASQKGDFTFLISGVLLVAAAIILNASAYGKMKNEKTTSPKRGIFLALAAGLLMSFFYRFIAGSMDLENFHQPAIGKMTPYTAVFIFSIGILVSNILFNTILIKRPLSGSPGTYAQYFSGAFRVHIPGLIGGVVWGIGNSFNLIAAGKAGAAVSYGLGQGATLVAALWGVFIWKEFKGGSRNVAGMLAAMFACFIAGLALIIYAGL
jgi:glucose uptake protein